MMLDSTRLSGFLSDETVLELQGFENYELLENKVIKIFDGDQLEFKQFLYKVIDIRMRRYLANDFNLSGFADATLISSIHLGTVLDIVSREFPQKVGLVFPDLQYTKFKIAVMVALLVMPLALTMYLASQDFVIALIIFDHLGFWGMILPIMIPYAFARIFFQGYFRRTKLSAGILTYRDLAKEVVLDNRIEFAANDYRKTRSELYRIVMGDGN
jgi:hypothetical protein